jgi:exportin-1
LLVLLIQSYAHLFQWGTIINRAQTSAESLCDPDTVQRVINIVRVNTRACSALGHSFKSQLLALYDTMVNVYKVYSEMISGAVQRDGPVAAQHSNVRAMRSAKRDIIRFIETFVDKTDDSQFVCLQVGAMYV